MLSSSFFKSPKTTVEVASTISIRSLIQRDCDLRPTQPNSVKLNPMQDENYRFVSRWLQDQTS